MRALCVGIALLLAVTVSLLLSDSNTHASQPASNTPLALRDEAAKKHPQPTSMQHSYSDDEATCWIEELSRRKCVQQVSFCNGQECMHTMRQTLSWMLASVP